MTLLISCVTVVIILVAPGVPSTMNGEPSSLSTTVGLIGDNGVLPGAMALGDSGSAQLFIDGDEQKEI